MPLDNYMKGNSEIFLLTWNQKSIFQKIRPIDPIPLPLMFKSNSVTYVSSYCHSRLCHNNLYPYLL